MDIATRTLTALAPLITEFGCHADLIPGAMVVAPLNLLLTASHHLEESAPGVQCIQITATNPSYFPDGIEVHAVGIGQSDETVASRSAESWFNQAFPAIHSLLCGTPTGPVQVLDLVTLNQATDQILAWKAHIAAPVNYAVAGDPPPPADPLELFQELLGPVSALLLDRKTHALSVFLGVLPSGHVHTECRFDGLFWDQGTETLAELGNYWAAAAYSEMRKQFMLFAPCPLADLRDGEALAARTREEARKQPP